MGIKDKLKRTSRIFLSDSKEDLAGNGGNAATGEEIEEATENATASAAADGVNDSPTDNAEGTLASSGDQEEAGMRVTTGDVSESAPGAGGDTGGEPSEETDAVKRRSLLKKLTSKAKKPASGDTKRGEIFQKFLKKFKRPVGVPPQKPTPSAAAKTAENDSEVVAAKAEPKAEPMAEPMAATKAEAKEENPADNVIDAAHEVLLDPATEGATGATK